MTDQTGTEPLNRGDDAPEGAAGTGEDVCRHCNGTGKQAGATCPVCEGSGKVTEGIGGG